MRIALIGWWGRGNMGDELLHSLLREWLEPHDVAALVPQQLVERNPGQFLSFAEFDVSADEYDLVIFGGGLLNNRYVRAVMPEERLARINSPLFGLSLGVPSPDWLEGLEPFVGRCDYLSVRDPLARGMVLQRYPDVQVDVLPDPGFLLAEQACRRSSDTVGLNIRDIPPSWLMGLPEDTTQRLQGSLMSAIEELADEGLAVQVLGTEPRDQELFSGWGVDSTMITADNAAGVVGNLAALVTMRLHGGIVALTQGTPVRVLNYQSKIAGLGSMVSQDLVHDVTEVSIARLARAALSERRGRYAERVDQLRASLAEFRDSRIG